MSKLPYTKLGLKLEQEVINLNTNNQIIEVKQYLPIQEKLELAATVLTNCQDDNNFMNKIKAQAFFELEIIFRYTNITFTEKQKEDYAKLYDLLKSNGIIEKVCQAIPNTEYVELYHNVLECINAFYTYRNSAYAIMDSMKNDYDNLKFNIDELSENISDEKNLTLVKDILTKIG